MEWFPKIEGRPSILGNCTAVHYYRYCLHHQQKWLFSDVIQTTWFSPSLFFFVKFDCESKYRYNYLWFKTSVLDFLTSFLSSGPTSGWSWQKTKFDNPVAILWENWVASIGSIWRGFGWDSSQTEVLQSPWISKKWPKHLLIFPSAQYNHIVGGMMKKREAQKIEKKLKIKLDLKFCDFGEERGSWTNSILA